MEHNLVSWFEIPVEDMDRAKAFYDAVFNINIDAQNFAGTLMGFFPFAENKPGAMGSLIQHDAYKPSDSHGVLVYFSSLDVDIELGRVEAAGGTITKAKTQISPDVGYMGTFTDTEGNRIALHSRK